MKKIYFFLGTTAELIKVAPVMREFKRRKIDFKIISSNQNSLNFDELKFLTGRQTANYTLKINAFKWPKNIYLRFVVWTIKTLGNYLVYFRAEFADGKGKYLIVHGDTVSALMGAIIAKFYGVKLVHIESGLRSFNFLEPFPEEICRFIISWLADIHFCPNDWAMANLRTHPGKKINTFYNTVFESLSLALRTKKSFPSSILKGRKYFVLVMHRQEHVVFKKNLSRRILQEMIAHARRGLVCTIVMHKITEDFLRREGFLKEIKNIPNIVLLPRVDYSSFIKLLDNSEFVVTDGGSNQEELSFLGKPCLIIRGCTERIEGLGENAVLLRDNLKNIGEFMKNYKNYKRKRIRMIKSPSKIIVDYFLKS